MRYAPQVIAVVSDAVEHVVHLVEGELRFCLGPCPRGSGEDNEQNCGELHNRCIHWGAPAIGGLHCASVQACALRDNSTEEIAPAVVVDRLSGIPGRRTKAQTISGGCFQTVSGSAWVPSLIRIDLPAGHYVPLFRRNTSEEADDSKLVTTTPAIAASGRLQAVAHDPHSNLGGVMPGAGRSPGSKLSTNRNLTQRQTN